MEKFLPKLLIAMGVCAMLVFAFGTLTQLNQPEPVVANYSSPQFQEVRSVEALPGEKMVAAGVKNGVISEPMVSEQVNLPNSEGKPWLTFLYADDWKSDPETVRLHDMFVRDPRLVALRGRCRVNTFNKMTETDRLSWCRYAGNNTPTIVLQMANGQLVSKISRANMPANSDQLYAMIKNDCDRCRPRPTPVQPVQPATPVQPESPLPDTVLPPSGPSEPDNGDPLWILGVVGVLGVMGGVALGLKDKKRRSR